LTLTIMSASRKTASASGQDDRALSLVVGVRDRRALARSGLHDDLVVVLDKLRGRRRRERDAVLVCLDLGGTPTFTLLGPRFYFGGAWHQLAPAQASQKSIRSRAESSERPVSSSTRRIR
jgi:hypothetical protein